MLYAISLVLFGPGKFQTSAHHARQPCPHLGWAGGLTGLPGHRRGAVSPTAYSTYALSNRTGYVGPFVAPGGTACAAQATTPTRCWQCVQLPLKSRGQLHETKAGGALSRRGKGKACRRYRYRMRAKPGEGPHRLDGGLAEIARGQSPCLSATLSISQTVIQQRQVGHTDFKWNCLALLALLVL